MNSPAAGTFSVSASVSSFTGFSRALDTGTSALRAMTSRGVHSARARRSGVCDTAPWGAKIICSIPVDGESVRS